jgi:neurofibromin 1
VNVSSSMSLDVASISLGGDGTDVEGRIFNKYLLFFLNVLQSNQRLAVLYQSSDSHKSYHQTSTGYTVLALSELLSANIEIGLKYALGLAYKEEDVQIRIAFAEVCVLSLLMG